MSGITHHLSSYEDKYPDRVNGLEKQLLVDDWMGSEDDVVVVTEPIVWTENIFKEAIIPLTK
jgi:hypothetical protein